MDDILWLEYYIVIDIPKSMTLKDSIQCISWPFKIETLIIEKDNLYRQTDSGRKVKRIFDRSFKTRWSWLFGHRYRIIKN
jgi:hypothetical protein